jgi:DNA-binding transcriptional regulator GbsR (MarR family)
MEKLRQKIEETASVWEQIGLTPVAARVYSYLLYAPHYSTTFEDLSDYFNVSKSAISNAIKYLTLAGMAASKTRDGQRKRFFGADLDYLIDIDNITKKHKLFIATFQQVLKNRKNNDALKKDLEDIIIYFEMAMSEYPGFIDRWKKRIK